jgi:threonine/homoserine/homoserine lactone efflux protein
MGGICDGHIGSAPFRIAGLPRSVVMVDLATLSVFLFAALALFLSPGPNMAFVLSQGVAHGPRGGAAAALGIAAADLVLTVLTATGVTALVAAWPLSFDLLRYGGAVYLVWLAVQALRSPGRMVVARGERVSLMRVFRRATLNSLLNPKALLFFMVFLPQFVVPSRGEVVMQLVAFGCVLSLTGLLFNLVLGSFSGQIGVFVQRHPRGARYQAWFLAAVLLTLAARLLLLERTTPR